MTKQQPLFLPKRHAKGGTNLTIVCVGAYYMRQSVNTPPVWLIQSATEIMEYGLAMHGRKENLTKDNIPIIAEPVIDAVQAIFPHR